MVLETVVKIILFLFRGFVSNFINSSLNFLILLISNNNININAHENKQTFKKVYVNDGFSSEKCRSF